jgi:hypothetical protein
MVATEGHGGCVSFEKSSSCQDAGKTGTGYYFVENTSQTPGQAKYNIMKDLFECSNESKIGACGGVEKGPVVGLVSGCADGGIFFLPGGYYD